MAAESNDCCAAIEVDMVGIARICRNMDRSIQYLVFWERNKP